MLSFQEMFLSQHNDCVLYNGQIIRRNMPFTVNGQIRLKFRDIQASSPYTQAIVVVFPPGFSGNVYLDGRKIPVKNSAFPKLNFWADTAPSEFVVEIFDYFGDILVCNGSDPLGTKQFCKHLSAGCAMIVEEVAANKFRCLCNDHEDDDDFQDLIFSLEIS